MKQALCGIGGYLMITGVLLAISLTARAQVLFSDNFNSGASSLWNNHSGNWTAAGGVYNALNPFSVNYSGLPFILTDFAVDVDINDVADGGIWLRSDATGRNGILLVTGGEGWGFGDRSASAGRSLYWHVIRDGSIGAISGEVKGLFTPEVSDVHLRVEVIGDTYSAYLNDSSTPVTTLTSESFLNGSVGLYDFSAQAFDNFSVQPIPEPSTIWLLGAGAFGMFVSRGRRQEGSSERYAQTTCGPPA